MTQISINVQTRFEQKCPKRSEDIQWLQGYLRFPPQFPVTKGTGPPLLNKNFFHNLDQFAIIKNLFDDMGMGLSIIFTVRKATLPAHLSAFMISFKFIASSCPCQAVWGALTARSSTCWRWVLKDIPRRLRLDILLCSDSVLLMSITFPFQSA